MRMLIDTMSLKSNCVISIKVLNISYQSYFYEFNLHIYQKNVLKDFYAKIFKFILGKKTKLENNL